MNPKRFLAPGLLAAALTVAACGPTAEPKPIATPTLPPPTDTSAPTAVTEKPTAAPSLTAATPSLSATEESAAGEGEVPMGFTEEGAPYRGNPNAPVTLLEYSDFQ